MVYVLSKEGNPLMPTERNGKVRRMLRDGHTCLCCRGKSKDPILNVHHIESRQTGGDSPGNLVTLCETCHKAYHAGKVKLDIRRSTKSLRDAAVMNTMRWETFDRAKALWGDVRLTYGYITKDTRIRAGLEKSKITDARCVSGHPEADSCPAFQQMRQVRRHNRSLHVLKPGRHGRRRSAIAAHWIGKTRLQQYDTVSYKGMKVFISGSSEGRPVLKTKDWEPAEKTATVNPGKVRFISRKHGSFILTTRTAR